jgi:hypothetical protein
MCGIIGIIARDMVASGLLLGGIAKLLGVGAHGTQRAQPDHHLGHRRAGGATKPRIPCCRREP